jgi:hypothetical protein
MAFRYDFNDWLMRTGASKGTTVPFSAITIPSQYQAILSSSSSSD